MAKFTDIFIRRPVLATVVSLLIFFVGLRSLAELPVRQFPKIDNTVIKVTTSYPGANASLIEGFITSQLEKQIATADGIDYITSTSDDNKSTIKAYIKLNYDPNAAFTDIMSKVAQEQDQLPKAAEKPVIEKYTGSQVALMYISFIDPNMSPEQLTDYLTRVVQPKIETVSGISQAQIMGGYQFAMRIWMDPNKLAALGVTPADVQNALLANNFQSAAGKTKGRYISITVNATTDAENAEQFNNIIVKHGKNGALVHLRDIGKVVLDSESYDSSVTLNGKKAVFMSIQATPDANPLTVISQVQKLFPSIVSVFPPGMKSSVVYDVTSYIRASIHEVLMTIFEAAIIVIIVIFLFLGSLRTVIIPIVTIPLSLIGVFGCMLALNYSINLLTLLSLVLAIGLVVDDAIVVVENVYRHVEEGKTPFDAAIIGAREIAVPVISMTITLAAVYAPIGFMGGLTGALFTEFAYTLAATVIISGVIALTLSPMMCSKLLIPNISEQKFVQFIDHTFNKLKNLYEKALAKVLAARPVVIFFAFVVLLSCMFLYMNSKKELAPTEDQGAVFMLGTGPQDANIDYMQKFSDQLDPIFTQFPSLKAYFTVNGFDNVNQTISSLVMKPWDQRKQSQFYVQRVLQEKISHIAGLQLQSFPLPSLPTSGNVLPIQFIINSTSDFRSIYPVSERILKEAQDSGLFMFVSNDLKFNKPQVTLQINRAKVAQLGLNMQDIGQVLASSLGGNYVNYFNLGGRSYKVIPQLLREYRWNPDKLKGIYVRTAAGDMVPISTFVTMSYQTEPNSRTHFQQLDSTTINGLMAPGHTVGEGLDFLIAKSKELLPKDMSYDFAGQSRQFETEGSSLMLTFIFSVIVIFLVLAAQFESLRDPLVVMTAVPMAICGALLPINWGLATINIYTQIGLITLVGLISKHGILMVEFGNQIREEEGLDRIPAITKAASIRLRPVLMTTLAMVVGVVPLLLASGAGAASRFDMGLVISTGLSIGTLFTLFVVPTIYTLKTKTILWFLTAVIVTGYLINLVIGLLF